MTRAKEIQFNVQFSKSKQQIEDEMIQELVDEYLGCTYSQVTEQEEQKEIDMEIESYLDGLYKKIAKREEKIRQSLIEKEEVGKYFNSMVGQIVGKRVSKVLPVR